MLVACAGPLFVDSRLDEMSELAANAVGDAERKERVTPKDVFRAAGRSIGGVVDLAATEARVAALSLFGMLFLVIFAAAAMIVGWGLLVVVAISLLDSAGIAWQWSAAVAALLHGLLAFACWEIAARLSRNLTLPVLRRVLVPGNRPEVDKTAGEAQ